MKARNTASTTSTGTSHSKRLASAVGRRPPSTSTSAGLSARYAAPRVTAKTKQARNARPTRSLKVRLGTSWSTHDPKTGLALAKIVPKTPRPSSDHTVVRTTAGVRDPVPAIRSEPEPRQAAQRRERPRHPGQQDAGQRAGSGDTAQEHGRCDDQPQHLHPPRGPQGHRQHEQHGQTLACAGLAVLLVLPMTLRAAWWVQMLGLVVAAAVFLCGVTGARTLPGILLSGMAWPLASLRGLPWFGRSLRIAGTGSRTPAVVRTTVWSLLGLGVFGTIFASANPVFGSWVDQLVPNLTFNDLVGRAFLACFVFAV